MTTPKYPPQWVVFHRDRKAADAYKVFGSRSQARVYRAKFGGELYQLVKSH